MFSTLAEQGLKVSWDDSGERAAFFVVPESSSGEY